MGSAYTNRVRDGHSSRYGGIAVLSGCENVKIENIVFENSAHWTLKLEDCSEILVNKFIVNNNRHIENTDGIDVLYSRNVEISNTFISTADDGIVLKNWSADKIVENVHVLNCEVMSCTNSFKIGTETRGDIRNILVENCSFFMREIYPGTGAGIAIESVDGTKLTNVTVRNITMDRVACPLFIRLGNRNRYPDATSDFSGTINGVTVENITATNVERSAIITGVKNKDKGTNYVKNVSLKNFSLTYTVASIESPLYVPFLPEYENVYPDSGRFFNLSAYGIWARHTDGLTIENFNVKPPAYSMKRKLIFWDVKNLTAEH
ncbi:MAG: glycosyl hydrolase family 28 protein [Eubacteriales bacterium]